MTRRHGTINSKRHWTHLAVSALLVSTVLIFGNASAQPDEPGFCDDGRCSEEIREFRRYALNGDLSAMLFLAVVYANGEGVEKDTDEARRWMKESIRLRSAQAFHVKSGWRRNGVVFEQDIERADYWLERSVAANYVPALHEKAARNMQSGIADDETIDLLEEAAERGHIPSMYLLARLLEASPDHSENTLAAGKLYTELAHLGYRDAGFRLSGMISELEESGNQGAEYAAQLREFMNIERIEVRAFQGDFATTLSQFRMSLDTRIFDSRAGSRIRRVHGCDNSAVECATIFDRSRNDMEMGPSGSVGGFLNLEN